MKVKVNSVSNENKGKYNQLTIQYENVDKGTSGEKKLVSFGAEEGTYKLLKGAGSGSVWEIKLEKEGNYWKWKEAISSSGGDSGSGASGNKSPRSTFETPEERALRQVYIIRQSSLSNAIAVLKTEKQSPDAEAVLNLAEKFEQWVFRKDSFKAGVIEELPFGEEE